MLRSSTTAQPSASHSAGSGGASSATSTKEPKVSASGCDSGGGTETPDARAFASRVSSSERPSFFSNSARVTESGAQPAAMIAPSSFSIAASTEPGLTKVRSASPLGLPSASR